MLLCLVIPAGIFAGVFLERTTSLGSLAIQPDVIVEEMNADVAKVAELDETYRDLRRRMEAKDMLVAELLAGRITLPEVTNQFLALNQAREEYLAVIRSQYPGATDAEKTARNVISYASCEVGSYPPIQRARVLVRLEVQLRAHEQRIAGSCPLALIFESCWFCF